MNVLHCNDDEMDVRCFSPMSSIGARVSLAIHCGGEAHNRNAQRVIQRGDLEKTDAESARRRAF